MKSIISFAIRSKINPLTSNPVLKSNLDECKEQAKQNAFRRLQAQFKHAQDLEYLDRCIIISQNTNVILEIHLFSEFILI